MSNPFEAARTRATQRATADLQQNQDALKRRFAALGGLNSGAAIKQQQLLQERSQQQREEAIQGIDAAEADRDLQQREAQTQREFTGAEAEKQRGFQREQAGIDRGFQDRMFNFDKESKLKQMDLAFKQFKLQKDESEFNKRLERYKAGHSGGLFGGGGFLGLGIGAGTAEF
jgi:hypothetical protein